MEIEIADWELDEDDDDLMNELVETNPAFRAMQERSKASPRKPFDLGLQLRICGLIDLEESLAEKQGCADVTCSADENHSATGEAA